MGDAKISVIIPVYNTEKYLKECLDSVLKQTINNYEIICVDDASCDNSLTILNEYEKRDNRIQVHHFEVNRGQANARNYGISRAVGKYVFFLDSDDWIRENTFEILLNCAEHNSTEMILFDYSLVSDNKGCAYLDIDNRYLKYKKVSNGKDLFSELVSEDIFCCMSCCLFCLRSFLLKNGIRFDENLIFHEDVLFNFFCFMNAKKVFCLNDKLYYYRKRDGSSTEKPNRKRARSYFYVFEEIISFWRKKKYDKRIDEAVEKFLRYIINSCRFQILFSNENDDDDMKFAGDQFLYKMFKNYKIIDMPKCDLPEELHKKIEMSKRVFIYGAGRIGVDVFCKLKDQMVKIDGFIVTKKEGNPDSLLGVMVTELQEILLCTEDLIVISVSKKYQKDIIVEIEKKRHYNYIVFN